MLLWCLYKNIFKTYCTFPFERDDISIHTSIQSSAIYVDIG